MTSEPLRILHCFRSPVGGIFRHVRDLAAEQNRAGHHVGILCDSMTGGDYEAALFDSIRPHLALGLHRLPIDRSISLRDVPAFMQSFKEIRYLRPDVLHGHGAKGGAVARLVGTALRVNGYCVARLYSPHGGSLHYDAGSPSGRLIFALERLQESFSDALVFVCDYERRTYWQKVGRPSKPGHLIYNGVAEADFTLRPPAPEAVDFLYVGMLRDLKGPDVFVDAFARAERRLRRPLSALMVGDGPQEAKYRAMMTERGLGARIRMMPAMPVSRAFPMARTVVVPSRAESMPYIVLEAIAAGKTLIASRVGGIPEVLGPQSRALAEPGNSEDLGRIMADSIADPSFGPDTGIPRDAFHGLFSAEAMARRMGELYRQILDGLKKR